MENNSIQILKDIFNENDGYVIKKNNFNPFIWNIQSKTKDCLVLEFSQFSQTNIHINSLHKCGDKSGTTLLQKIDELAKKMSLEYIFMEDVSLIVLNGIEIDLAFFKILTTGESWYNSFGYGSVDYENELKYNEKLRNRNLMEVLNKYPKIIVDVEKLYSMNALFFENIPFEQLTIKKFFECSNRLIKTNQYELKPNQIETLQKLIEIIGNFELQYNRNLTKIFRTCHDSSCVINGGKKKTKNKKQKTKNKKTKTKTKNKKTKKQKQTQDK
jgi:hypothetical protein